MAHKQVVGIGMAAGLALSLAACGGTSTSPSSTGSTGGSTSTGTIAATITITAAGVSPKSVTVPVGSSVMFVNNDSLHEMTSDPHPTHTDCPPINVVGTLTNGQSRATAALTTARTCGFHDHGNPGNTALQGTIVIQ
jgi:plastocyanin